MLRRLVLAAGGVRVNLQLHGRGRRERLPPARRAGLPRGEPSVNAPRVEAVAAARQHADAVTLRELGEADGALRRAAAGEPIEPAGRADDRRDLLRDGASRLLPGYPGASLRRRLVAVIPGRLLAVAHAPRDAERAPGDRVEHEPDDEHAEEEGQDRDHRRVQRAERCRTTRRRPPPPTPPCRSTEASWHAAAAVRRPCLGSSLQFLRVKLQEETNVRTCTVENVGLVGEEFSRRTARVAVYIGR